MKYEPGLLFTNKDGQRSILKLRAGAMWYWDLNNQRWKYKCRYKLGHPLPTSVEWVDTYSVSYSKHYFWGEFYKRIKWNTRKA